MSNENLIFRNFRSIMHRGKDNFAGILYCGKQYTSEGGCACLKCDGFCGPDNGCPCPDCNYTLAYILYCTGEMNCPRCKLKLLRLNFFNIINLNDLNNNSEIICHGCNKTYKEKCLIFMHCRNCIYNLCPNCAFSKISLEKLSAIRDVLYIGCSEGQGIFYCKKSYTVPKKCICGSCDGLCGPYNGCPCPICDLILGYNIYLNSHMKCNKCSQTLLIKTTLIQLQKYMKVSYGIKCDYCQRYFDKPYTCTFHCFKCNFDLCQICAFDIIKGRKILYPYLPTKSSVNNSINYIIDIKEEKKENLRGKNEEEKKEKVDNGNDDMKCVVCLEANKSYLFLPCKHACCCEACAKFLKQCPICRKNIESSFKIFF